MSPFSSFSAISEDSPSKKITTRRLLSPNNENDTAPDIQTSTSPEAVAYRKYFKEQAGYKAKASSLTKTIKGFYDAFRQKFGHKATRFTYTLKCVGLE